ncbi:calcium:proton antiporter [Taklimakanibacter deserti]|uniref:calcium:proton antiporter n=1 Tax=Taklimakanibacter deserti TaxID=2267839 RepID=UPI000E64DFDA
MKQKPAERTAALKQFAVNEWFLAVSIGTGVLFALFGARLFHGLDEPFWLAGIFIFLFAVIMGSVLCAVRHADGLAEQLGEPYGTLVLTISITSIEVMSIATIMLEGANNPTLVRDTLFAVVMIILGGMVGLSLLLGALRHNEQSHNLQGANAYLGVIVPLAVLSLVMPNYTVTTPGPLLSDLQEIGLAVLSIGLYGVFLALQTGRHRGYFTLGEEKEPKHPHSSEAKTSVLQSALLLIAYLISIVFLVHELAVPINYTIETLAAPVALGGLILAVLVATPEAIGAIKAALENRLQRSVNIFLGSVLSTIGLTVPTMLAISWLTGHPIILGVENTDLVLLLLTLAVSVITFSSGRTNLLQGAVHVVLFLAFLLLIVQD